MKKDRSTPVILWFRQDLRLEDNPALQAAIQSGKPILPVYILDEAAEGSWTFGEASRWWLHHALTDLRLQLKGLGGELVFQRGKSLELLQNLVSKSGAYALYWNRRYEPLIIKRDKRIKTILSDSGIEVRSFNASLLHEPHTVLKKDNTPFKVFTPYWKHCLKMEKTRMVSALLKKAQFVGGAVRSENLDSWNLLPTIPWDKEFYDSWKPTVAGGSKLLKQFTRRQLARYGDGRNMLAEDGTSRLSPYLHFGQLGPRQIWDEVSKYDTPGNYRYLAEIGWREFSFYLLYHFPHLDLKPLRSEFEDFPWEKDEQLFDAWSKGRTGFPLVDAGMRQLWQTGWMHNRARMITASFLVKHLLQPWQDGAYWFWDTLVDSDLASNSQGWQWTAGCGADASPYFRVFNPILQGKKLDPDGIYVRRWVPEIGRLSNRFIHQPSKAPETELDSAGIRLGIDYPFPIIDHSAGRSRALKAFELFQAVKKTSA